MYCFNAIIIFNRSEVKMKGVECFSLSSVNKALNSGIIKTTKMFPHKQFFLNVLSKNSKI